MRAHKILFEFISTSIIIYSGLPCFPLDVQLPGSKAVSHIKCYTTPDSIYPVSCHNMIIVKVLLTITFEKCLRNSNNIKATVGENQSAE